jgi:hypothetical protein
LARSWPRTSERQPGNRRLEDLARPRGLERRALGQVGDQFREARRREDGRGADPGGLRPAAGRTEEHAPVLARGERRRQRAEHRHQPPVERQFAQRHAVGHAIRRHDTDGGEAARA